MFSNLNSSQWWSHLIVLSLGVDFCHEENYVYIIQFSILSITRYLSTFWWFYQRSKWSWGGFLRKQLLFPESKSAFLIPMWSIGGEGKNYIRSLHYETLNMIMLCWKFSEKKQIAYFNVNSYTMTCKTQVGVSCVWVRNFCWICRPNFESYCQNKKLAFSVPLYCTCIFSHCCSMLKS